MNSLGIDPPNPSGLCECGCGERTSLAKKTTRNKGWVKGEHVRFIHGHHARGSRHPAWNDGRTVDERGYVRVRRPDHPRAHSDGYVYEHILVAERSFGGPLPPKAEVHHVDGNKTNNDPPNLVVCQDRAYHMLLHQRQRALESCGHAEWLKCDRCGKYDDPSNMYVYPIGTKGRHRECYNRYQREQYARGAAS